MNRKELIFNYFDFLTNNFGYKKSVLDEYEQRNITVVTYESILFKKRIEIAITKEEYIYIIIRYAYNGKYANYNDKLYSIDMNGLYQLICSSYELDYSFTPTDKVDNYFERSRKLLLYYKSLLLSDSWIDIEKYVEIKKKYYTRILGCKWQDSKLSIQQEFEDEIIKIFPNIKALYNSEKQPPYDYSEGWNISKYELNNHLIVFRMPDWRDYNLYDVTIDNIGGYLLDICTDYKGRLKEIMENIKKRCG